MIARQCQHLTRLAQDLLDVSKIGRGKPEVRSEPVELQAIVAVSVETAQSQIERRGQKLSVELPGAPTWLTGDGWPSSSRISWTMRRSTLPRAARSVSPPDQPIARSRSACGIPASVFPRIGGAPSSTVHGPAALQVLNEFKPDVVLLDLDPPGMDGHQVARRMQAGRADFRLTIEWICRDGGG